jgi:cyclin B
MGGRPATASRMPRSLMEKENAVPGNGLKRSPRLGNFGASRGLARSGPGAGLKALSDATNLNDASNFIADPKASRDKKKLCGAQGTGGQKRQALGAATRVATGEQPVRVSVPVVAPVSVPPAPPRSTCMPNTRPSQDTTDDLMWGGDYAQDLFNHLFLEEANFLPRPDYMEKQTEINHKMRAILVDWLVEVHKKYRLRQETLFLTVSLIDRYLSRTVVVRRKLQLVGVVAMFIAAKFEEITPPEAVDFAYITDNAYSKDDILQMECTMLTTLGFLICGPTVVHFSDRLHNDNQSDAIHREVGYYLCELALVEYRMIRFLPSHLVAAATLLSNELVGRDVLWPACVAQQARYTEDQLQTCVNELHVLLEAAPKSSLQAVRRQYMLPQHHCVASMTFRAAAN